MTKLQHFDHTGTARFVTFSCYHRYQVLNDNRVKFIFVKQFGDVCQKYQIEILGYVIMPEHIHLVLFPKKDIQIGKVIGELKSKSAREILKLFKVQNNTLLKKLYIKEKFVFWQKRCYDHNCRTIDTVREKIEYCHKNPVKRGLVRKQEDWLYSSFRWYKRMDNVILEIDGIKL